MVGRDEIIYQTYAVYFCNMTYVFALSTALKSRICEPLCAQSNKICICYLPESNSRHERLPRKSSMWKKEERKIARQKFVYLGCLSRYKSCGELVWLHAIQLKCGLRYKTHYSLNESTGNAHLNSQTCLTNCANKFYLMGISHISA